MPGAAVHSQLTRAALELQPRPVGDPEALIADYCNYPDRCFSQWDQLKKYTFFLDGIQFHYLPDTPWNELYRYWKPEDGTVRRARKFVNENFRHAHAGFDFCITNFLREYDRGQEEEAKKFLGCLLHMLEDSTFAFHTMEGPGGADAFVLDRLMDAPFSPAAELAKLSAEGLPMPDYRPGSLGGTPGEFLMRLYAEYVRAASRARKFSFRYLLAKAENRPADAREAQTGQYHNSVKLCADVIFTLYQLARGEECGQPDPFPLTELEPHEFPFGGPGAYCCRSIDHDFAMAPDGTRLPLELDNGGRCSSGLAFGNHFEGSLRYWIAPGVFGRFTARLGYHSALRGKGETEVGIVNGGRVVRTLRLDPDHTAAALEIPDPQGDFGLSFRNRKPSGVLVLAEPVFHRIR